MTLSEIGNIAEEIALNHIKSETSERGTVRLVSSDQSLGYDIEAIDFIDDSIKFRAIEVKTWNQNGCLHITDNEVQKLQALGSSAWIYLVDINKRKVVKMINASTLRHEELHPVLFKLFY